MWFGQLTMTGVDPREWDLNQMLAAFEVTMRQGAKDEAEWRRQDGAMRAVPKEVRDQQRKAGRAAGRRPLSGGMSVDDAEAMLARFAANEAQYQ